VTLWIFLCAAVLLSFERICYLWIWHAPERFQSFCNGPALSYVGGPVDVLRFLFVGFKVLQLGVFLGWCFIHGNGTLWPVSENQLSLTAGASLIVAGQWLNVSVFYRLGKIGVFYGNKFGYKIRWCREFPFSYFDHPQYAGALLSIWGFFLIMRFPQDDWYLLPALETLYYTLGARFER
jgi:phosphatidyl-N-methylethanolamine N-methyltransferase